MGQILAMFRVDGRPRTKGSLSVHCMKNRAHTVRVTEEVEESKHWRSIVALACRRHQAECWGGIQRHAGPVEVRMVAYFDRTESVARDAAPGAIIPSHQTPFPTDIKLGDGDKLARNVGDALALPRSRTENAYASGLLMDDSQITDWMIAKRWATPEHPAGVEILVMGAEDAGPPYWMAEGISRA